jgi:hypothetical protein
MISEKKFWACVLFIYIIGTSIAIYGESKKSASQEQPKYELKSDIINFDYTKLSYPSSGISVGIETNETLKERKPGRQITEDEIIRIRIEELVGGGKILLKFILILTLVYGTFGLLPSGIVYYYLQYRRKRIDKRKEKEKQK